MRPAAHNLGSRSGFTLIELMVVLTLIAILTAAIVPEMRGSLEGTLLRSSSRKLVEILALANSRAVSRNETHRVYFDIQKGHFQLERQAGRSARPVGFFPVQDISATAGELDPRIALELRPSPGVSPSDAPIARPSTTSRPNPKASPPTHSISFQPDGTTDAIDLVLHDRSGHQVILRLNPITARIRIVEAP